MIEEMSMAVAMSVVFALPTYYFCELQGSFFVVWLVWLVSLADGIGGHPSPPPSPPPHLLRPASRILA